MSKFLGVLIRRERLRRSLSQEGLCRGICAVSYLSKIEQGKAEAGDDILLPLLRRLGVEYETDPDFLAQAEDTISALYDELLSGRDTLRAFQDKLDWLKEHRERCLSSPFLLDTLLLLCCQLDRPPEGLEELEEFVPCMDRRQYGLYLMARLAAHPEEDGEELLRLDPSPYHTFFVGLCRYLRGEYMTAADFFDRSYRLAAQEGYLHLMFSAKIYLGNCFSNVCQQERMLEHYRVVRRIADCLGDPNSWIDSVDYNVATTELELGRTEEAYALLLQIPQKGGLYFHKLAIALERLGRREEALQAAERGLAELGGASLDLGCFPEHVQAALELVICRLQSPDHLHDPVYVQRLEDTFRLLRQDARKGFLRFHIPYMLEVLEAQRRYKDAYQLSVEFSSYQGILPH